MFSLALSFCSCHVICILSVHRFVCKNNGVLYENDLIQIGVKSEYRQNLARIGVFYGNKTSFRFTNFTADISCPGDLSTHILLPSLLYGCSLEMGFCGVYVHELAH